MFILGSSRLRYDVRMSLRSALLPLALLALTGTVLGTTMRELDGA